MSAIAPVLLRYHGGEVYALPTADRHVWSVAGVEVHVALVASHAETGEVTGAETPNTLATAAEHRLRLKREAARRAPAKRASKTKAQSAPRRGR